MGKGKNDDMGCVGFGSGGMLKQNKIRVFCTDDSDPENVLSEHREFYGKAYTLKYILTDNPEKILKKYVDEFEDDEGNFENLLTASNKTASDLLRTFAGEGKQLKTYGRKPKSKKSKDDDEDDKKKSKSKGKKDKKSKKESDNESESDEDDKKKKKSSKKPAKKSKKEESDESGSESD